MELARVIGRLVATQKHPDLRGVKLLIIQPLNHRLEPQGLPEVAVDGIQAGPGDLVYWSGGREGALMLSESYVPVDAGIVGIVDQVNLDLGEIDV